MNILNKLVLSAVSLTSISALAQVQDAVNYDYYSSTTEKTVPYEKDGEIVPVKMKIVETRNYSFKFEEEDKGKIDKDLVATPIAITKKIYVDNDNDELYDKFIVMSYEKYSDEAFEIIPTDNSVAIKIDEKSIAPVTSEGFIIADTDDAEVIMIETYANL